jgi:CHAT domain-containing protein
LSRFENQGDRSRSGEPDELVYLGGRKASETAFKRLAPGKRVLHLATHGFFLTSTCSSDQRVVRGIGGLSPMGVATTAPENPPLLAGLAFAGANQRDALGPEEEDGILTAEEIATMDLAGVELAILSACDTGVGKVQVGEGVVGLSRAFQVAGVRTVIMSLRAVDDRASEEFMTILHEEHLKNGVTPEEAVTQASLRLLENRKRLGLSTHPFYWGAWVAVGPPSGPRGASADRSGVHL